MADEKAYNSLHEERGEVPEQKYEGGGLFADEPGKPIANLANEPSDLYMLFEVMSHQYQRVRGGRSTHLRIMRFLYNHGSANLKDLHQALVVKPSALSEIVTKLEDRGFVTRTISKRDRRVKDLRLTAQGEKMILQQLEREKQIDLFSSLSAEERQTLETLLRTVEQDWRQRETKKLGAGKPSEDE